MNKGQRKTVEDLAAVYKRRPMNKSYLKFKRATPDILAESERKKKELKVKTWDEAKRKTNQAEASL